VLVPGGGWASADPTGLIPLAERLTAEGMSTSLITYSTTGSGSTFPVAADDVACAVRWSVQQAAASGHPARHVILLGHSAGGHLAALAALSGEEFGGECPYPPTRIDGLIGLAGVYDTAAFGSVMSSWMGVSPSGSPDTWRRANPTAWLRDGTEVPEDLRVLLVHGDADVTVPLDQTTMFADGLQAAGVDVSTVVLEDMDHLEVFQAASIAPLVRSWMDGRADG
jgi:acetyl esterase/lipase